MAAIPQEVREAFGDQGSAPVFTTGDPSGLPNAIYATCIRIFDDETFVIADNYFNKTKKNLLSGSRGTILFITSEKKAYQVKGMIEYVSEGEYFDFMKSWNPEHLPGHAAAVLKVESVYSGAEKLA